MSAEDMAVDTLSLAEFHQTLQRRLDESLAALAMLDPGLDAHGYAPALGGFEDARWTGERHQRLREEYVARLRRLASAITAAQAATADIIAKYRSVEALNTANVVDVLRPIGEELDHGRTHGG